MGRDLSGEFPVLIYEHLSDGTYRARFETIRKGQIPAYEDGTPLKMEELTYKNMESDALPDATGTGDQLNEYALPLFREASQLLFSEISPLFETRQDPQPSPDPDPQSETDPQSDTQPESQQETPQRTQQGSQQETQPGSQQETQPDSQQETRSESKQATQPDQGSDHRLKTLDKIPETGDGEPFVYIGIIILMSAAAATGSILRRKRR